MRIPASPVKNGLLALGCLLLAVFISAGTSLTVQSVSIHHIFSLELFLRTPEASLVLLDILAPLSIALLSRKAFAVFLFLQTCMGAIILHYGNFFYNTLTLSTIYHSMQGLSYLGNSVLDFMRMDIVLSLGIVLLAELGLLWLSAVPEASMPGIWRLRGAASVLCFMVISTTLFLHHGRTGISNIWVDGQEHRTAVERRTQEGTEASVRHTGFLATWLGEAISGVYKDTSLIYADRRCPDPHADEKDALLSRGTWHGVPLPKSVEEPPNIVLIQVESLDFAALSMEFNGRRPMPFLRSLLPDSVLLKVFAPHKVGSANSDYELLNGRIADQNVMYYSYIRDYPDSVIHLLDDRETAAFHGMEGSLFNLRGAYGLMGLDHLFFKEELMAEGYPPSELTMGHIKDADVLDAAARWLNDGYGRAAFIVTMSSHIPFMEPTPGFRLGNGLFSRYVSSLSYVDRCLAEFYERLRAGTLIILWGDHSCDIPYPEGIAPNGKLVPFLVHVKGERGWLDVADAPRPDSLNRTGYEARENIYTLCQLSHYLRRVLEAVR